MKLREYQEEAIGSANLFLRTKKGNPAIVLPTGSGKSLVMAKMVLDWVRSYPHLKVMVLAHRKELVEQNLSELKKLNPPFSLGIYSAALKKRQTNASVTFASIDSVYSKCSSFPVQDVFLIDEAHRIPVSGEGKYRTLIESMKNRNEKLKVLGLTATPYRMGVGNICHPDHILNEVCYEAPIKKLIEDGYLCPVRTIDGEHSKLDLSGIGKIAGEYNKKQLSSRVTQEDVVDQATRHFVLSCNQYERKSVLVFCIDVDHCKAVYNKLKSMGISSPYIIGSTGQAKRDELIHRFREGGVRFLLSVDCFFEGFNAPCVDCVVMLRPTQSKGIWVQAVGRGLRTFNGKKYCLILDYGDNIQRHGPIDLDQGQDIVLHECEKCKNNFNKKLRVCPSCGFEIPKTQRRNLERLEKIEKKLHNAFAASGDIFSSVKKIDVQDVSFKIHNKPGKPPSVRIEFRCGLSLIKKWITVEHEGYAKAKSQQWLRLMSLPDYNSSKEMVSDPAFQKRLKEISVLEVNGSGKYPDIVSYE
jgi:DNA repair protein RadD